MNPRTNRPVGYAFVDLASVEQAQAAIAALSGNEILERKVSVQVAQKPDLHKDGDNGEGRKRGQNRTRGRGRGRGGRLGRSGRRNQQNTEGEAAQSGNEQTATTTAPLADSTNEGNEQSEHAKDQNKPRRAPRHRGPPEDGIPSKTKVMVANLPYDLNEDKLKEIFAAYNPVSVKVALRPIPRFMVKKLQARNEPRKGRGFGFVTLATEEMQQKAVKEMSGKEIEGREIAVKVAIDSPGKEDSHEEGDGAAANGEKKEENKEKAADVAAPAAAAAAAPATAAPAGTPAEVPVGEKKEAAPAAATA
ncbi:ribose-phosphate pyrophosphokinase [Ascosphaera pollenicola]|nr:ribose-phosphate pyrophosphokinase [Ascosphaera pollenicola]